MTEPPDRTAILRRAQQIIRARGWSPMMSSNEYSPLNIRCAVARACTELIGWASYREWYELYLDSVHAVSSHLKAGLTDWEFTAKSTTEVDAMITEVLNRLEDDDIKPRSTRSRPRPTGL